MSEPPVPPVSPTPPPAPAPVPRPQPPRDLLTPGMIEALRKTKPWVRFLSIVGFVCVGLMILIGLGMIGFGVYQIGQPTLQPYILIGMGVFYLLLGVLYIFPSRYLYRYASAIKSALAAQYKSASVEQALVHQKSFWKFAGILTLVMLLLYIPGVLAAIAIPNFLTALQRAKQKRSVADIRSIAAAVEAYATDRNEYPNVHGVQELAPLLQPTYIRTLPRLDGWGNAFFYEGVDCESSRCSGYVLASGGQDGRFTEPPSSLGKNFVGTRTFDEDIVFTNGTFIRAPQ